MNNNWYAQIAHAPRRITLACLAALMILFGLFSYLAGDMSTLITVTVLFVLAIALFLVFAIATGKFKIKLIEKREQDCSGE